MSVGTFPLSGRQTKPAAVISASSHSQTLFSASIDLMKPHSCLRRVRHLHRHSLTALHNVLNRCLPFHSAAWRATREPIEILLNEADSVKQDELTAKWRDAMQQQLMVTAVTVS